MKRKYCTIQMAPVQRHSHCVCNDVDNDDNHLPPNDYVHTGSLIAWLHRQLKYERTITFIQIEHYVQRVAAHLLLPLHKTNGVCAVKFVFMQLNFL